jgi:integrase
VNDLALIPPIADTLPANLTREEMASTLAYADNATAESTRLAYEQDMTQFRHWCTARGLCPLPATPASIAAYLAHLADSGRKASGIGRACAGIAWHHRQAGVDPSPTAHQGVKATMRGIRRKIGSRSVGKNPATHDIVGAMMAGCPDTMIGLRDAALLGIGFAAALRRSELVAITVEDITFVDDGLRLLIPRSKTDQQGSGAEVAVLRGVRLRPVAALQAWLDASGITTGPVFRAVKLGGKISEHAMKGDAVARVMKKHCRRLGIDPTNYSAHSLRAGLITSSAEANANIFRIQLVSRHRSLESLQGYVRSVDIFKEHCTASFM